MRCRNSQLQVDLLTLWHLDVVLFTSADLSCMPRALSPLRTFLGKTHTITEQTSNVMCTVNTFQSFDVLGVATRLMWLDVNAENSTLHVRVYLSQMVSRARGICPAAGGKKKMSVL